MRQNMPSTLCAQNSSCLSGRLEFPTLLTRAHIALSALRSKLFVRNLYFLLPGLCAFSSTSCFFYSYLFLSMLCKALI